MMSGISAVSLPRATAILPMRGILLRGSKVRHFLPGKLRSRRRNPSGRRRARRCRRDGHDAASGDVEAATEGEREMSEVAADADALVERLERRSARARLQIVEFDVLMHEIADGLHTPPSRRERAEHITSRPDQSVGFAMAAAYEIDEAFVGQVGGGNLPRVRYRDLGSSRIFDRQVAP
jgi:hypothetical protein